MTAPTRVLTEAQQQLLARMSAPAGEREGLFPVTTLQRGLWLTDQLSPGDTAYHMPALLRLHGRLDVRRLDAAIQAVVDRHEGLRTTFVGLDGRPLQRVIATRRHQLSIVDSVGRPADAVLVEARDAAFRPFDLAVGPLLRSTLWRLGPDDHVLLVVLHHIIADGWSVGLLLGELLAALGDNPVAPPAAGPQPVDLALREASAPVDPADLDYWIGATDSATPPGFPERTDERIGPPCGTTRAVLPDALMADARDLARAQQTTEFAVHLAAVAVVAQRMTGQRDIVIGLPLARRSTPDVQRTVGYLVNTVPVRLSWPDGETFTGLVARTTRAVREAMAHGAVPFDTVVAQRVAATGSSDRARLLDLQFRHDPELVPGGAMGSLRAEAMPLDARSAKTGLSLAVQVRSGASSLAVEFDADRFDQEVASSLAHAFATLLAAAVENPDAAVDDLPILTPAQIRRRLELDGRRSTSFPGWPTRSPGSPRTGRTGSPWSAVKKASRIANWSTARTGWPG